MNELMTDHSPYSPHRCDTWLDVYGGAHHATSQVFEREERDGVVLRHRLDTGV